MKSIFHLTNNLLRYEWADKRVIMGFLTGMVMPSWWLNNFLRYVKDTGEPANILETFPVIEHDYVSILFLALGWFLVISDAPFINGNTYYSLYRTKKRHWNSAMLLYICTQAALYTALIVLPVTLASLPYGYVGRMWSSPVYELSRDFNEKIVAKYHIAFSCQNMMRAMDVPNAFMATVLCFFLYLVLMGVILYTFNLVLGGIWGVIITFMIHIGGYELPYVGMSKLALIEYSRPANFIRNGWTDLVSPVAVILFLMAILAVLEYILIGKVNFKAETQGE